MPAVNRVPAVSGADAVEPPPAYQSIAFSVAPGNRPLLPEDKRNNYLSYAPTHSDPDALVVKFQTIVREEREIVVGRLKIPTQIQHPPHEHAFILRRYDTGAISVTTMYKAAFPDASPEEEEREMKWIKSSFDMNGMNGSRTCHAVKLAGNWIPPTLATHLAPAYKLSSWIDAMARANPEPGVAYRKSQRSQMAAEQVAANRARFEEEQLTAVQPSTNDTGNHLLAPTATTTPSTRAAPRGSAVARPVRDTTMQDAPAPKRSRVSSSQPEEASAAPAAAGGPSDETISVTLQSVTEIRAPTGTVIDAEAQIAESKAMVMRIKEEALARSRAGESAEDMGLVESSSAGGAARGLKRTAEVAETETSGFVGGVGPTSSLAKSALKPSVATTTEPARIIAGNRRIVKPEVAVRRQLAWGGLALGAGMALTYLAGTFF